MSNVFLSEKIKAYKNRSHLGEFEILLDGEYLGHKFEHCQCCGTRLSGDRYSIVYFEPENRESHEAECCVDCVRFLANGHNCLITAE